MLTPSSQAMLQGMQQGDEQAQSILPSSYQPQGRAAPTNPWEGTLSMIIASVLTVAHGVGQQGDNVAKMEESKLLKISYELGKIRDRLTKLAQDGAGQQQQQ